MRYKLVGLAVILLLASPAHGQNVSPVIVETPRTTTPTVVKTGELFRQDYVVRFFDSTARGEEIKIKEDELSSATMLGDFEVVRFNIRKQTRQGDYIENVWYLEYTLRIVNEKKSADLAAEKKEPYKIPRITIPWTIKKIGDDDSRLISNVNIKTDEVYINYVSTITSDPHLFIRDNVNFGDFSRKSFWFRVSSWLLWIIPPGLWVLVLVKRIRARSASQKDDILNRTADNNPDLFNSVQPISRRNAIKNIRKSIKRLKDFSGGKKADNLFEVISEYISSVMSFLRIEVPGASVGTTPREMLLLVRNLPDSSKRTALIVLADFANICHRHLENKAVPSYLSLAEDVSWLSRHLRELKWHRRLKYYISLKLTSLGKSIKRLPVKLKLFTRLKR